MKSMFYFKENYLLGRLFVCISCLLPLCQTQTYIHTNRRIDDSYSVPSVPPYSYYKTESKSSFSNSYHKQDRVPTVPSSQYVKKTLDPVKRSYRKYPNSNGLNLSTQFLHPSYSSFLNTKYLSNNIENESPIQTENNKRKGIAEIENSKFIGQKNQENHADGRTGIFKRKKISRPFLRPLKNPCYPYGRGAGKNITPPPTLQGRFLWDVNVYNVYPQTPTGLGCGNYGGLPIALVGGTVMSNNFLSDPISPAYNFPGSAIANFLKRFAPGILQNSLAVTGQPEQFLDYSQLSSTDKNLLSDPEVNPNYTPGPAAVPVRGPNPVFYDSTGAPAITPGQLVGGISTTVNGIIQQLTGNVKPVYG